MALNFFMVVDLNLIYNSITYWNNGTHLEGGAGPDYFYSESIRKRSKM